MKKKVDSALIRAARRELERHRDIVGKERDKLREIADEYAALADSCSDAFESLTCAIDKLSELA